MNYSFMKTKTILTLVTSLITTAAFAGDPLPVGSTAPDFSLTDAKGEAHSLSQYKGKYVVLEWFNPACPFEKTLWQRQHAKIATGIHR